MAVVFIVCVSPAVDLDDCCSLRSDQLSSLIYLVFGALMILAAKMNPSGSPRRQTSAFLPDRRAFCPDEGSLLDLVGTRRI